MFKDMVCVFVGPNDFLSYNKTVAALCSDYRVTGNAGVHLEESRRLTDDEIGNLLQQVEKLGEEIEERPPNDEETEIINRIQTLHPEVRYIIQSFHTVEAKEDEKGPGYRVKYKDKQEGEEPEEEPEIKDPDTPDEPEPKAEPKEPKAPKGGATDGLDWTDTPDSGKESGGWVGILKNMFDWWKNPDLTKEERALLKEELQDEKDELYKLYKKNKSEFEKLDKVFKKNEDLYGYIGKMVDADQIDAGSLSAFTELVTQNPELLDTLNISTHSSGQGSSGGISEILYDIRDFEDHIPELKDLLAERDKKNTNKIMDLFEDYFEKLQGFDHAEIKNMRVDIENEVLKIDALLKNVLDLYEETKITPYT